MQINFTHAHGISNKQQFYFMYNMFTAPLVDIINGTSFIAMRSIISKLVPSADELGNGQFRKNHKSSSFIMLKLLQVKLIQFLASVKL